MPYDPSPAAPTQQQDRYEILDVLGGWGWAWWDKPAARP